jgi:glycosyltransferase involved in cell wall biosynthesis
MNTEVVQDGVNGYLARNPAEWVERLAGLARDAAVRARLGQAAFETVQSSYSTDRGLRELRKALRR